MCGAPLRIAESLGGPALLADGRTVSPRYQCEGSVRHLFISQTDTLAPGPDNKLTFKLVLKEP
jgi:hypothetical protein